MIRPQLSPDGAHVLIQTAPTVAAVLDGLALAYAEAPEEVGSLLAAHADRVAASDHAQWSPAATDTARAMRAAEADGTREALADEMPEDCTAPHLLTPDDAITTAARLTRCAAHIRNRTTPKGTKP